MATLGRYIVMLGYAGARIALTLAELHTEEVQKRFPKHFLNQEEELRKVIDRLTGLANKTGRQSNEKSSEQVTVAIRNLLQGLANESLVLLQENEVFPALWKLAEGLDAGLDVELRKIPVLQFVIEVSELFDVNPYVNMTALENRKCFRQVAEKNSGVCDAGSDETTMIYSLLIVTDKPEELLAFAEENGLPSAVIGRLTEKNDRVVRNGEIIRYLTPEG